MPLPIRLALDVVADELHVVRRRPPAGAPDGFGGDPAATTEGAPLLLRLAAGLALPLWRDPAGAAEAATAAPGLRPLQIAADDLRAKEELLRDALELGAALIVHDPAEGREPAGRDLVQRALNEILAERGASACL